MRQPGVSGAGYFRLLLPASIVIVLIGAYFFWPYTIDDSYITYRYARNMATGHGPVFNTGERVEGFSSPAWVFVLGLAIKAGLDPVVASKVLGVMAAIGLLVVLDSALRRSGCSPLVSGLACLVLATFPTLHIYSTSGMETAWFALAVAVAALAPWREGAEQLNGWIAGAGIVAVVTLRPDGLLTALLLTLLWLGLGLPRRVRLPILSAWGVVAALMIARLAYYGNLFPNTFNAKPSPLVRLLLGGHLRYAVYEVWSSLLSNLLPALAEAGGVGTILLALAAVTLAKAPPARWGALMAGGAGCFFVAYARTDWMEGHRFAFPYMAPLLFLAAMGAQSLLDRLEGFRMNRLASGAALTTIIWCCWSAGQTDDLLDRYRHRMVNIAMNADVHLQIGNWLREHGGPDDRLLTYEVGAVGYGSGMRVIDHEGLVTPAIAGMVQTAEGDLAAIRFGKDQKTMLSIAEYCARQEPEWWLMRSYTALTPRVGESPIPEYSMFALERAILEKLGDTMVIAAMFEMRPPYPNGMVDRYLLLRRRQHDAG